MFSVMARAVGSGRAWRLAGGAVAVALLMSSGMSGSAGGAVGPQRSGAQPVPTVSGPVTGGQGRPNLIMTTFDLGRFGYEMQEYFIAGDAAAYTSAEPLTTNGRWTVIPSGREPFTTRMVVVRPTNPKRFNGTAIVEWLNVTPGFDNPAGWMMSHLVMLREGMAWVGVSAQAAGVQGGIATVGGLPPGGLKAADPDRYATLTHPGDSYSYDIFSQAGRAVRGQGAVRPLGELKVKRVIATGESQSAGRLVTYVNAVHPIAEVYDGFLIHSRQAGGAPLSQSPLPAITVPPGTVIRDDLDVPVLIFNTETDVGPIGAAAARQPDTRRIRTWEVAGTAHADAYTGQVGFEDDGSGVAERRLLDVTNPSRGPLMCETAVNSGPQYAVLMAALKHLDRWVRAGPPPPRGKPLEVTPGPPNTGGTTPIPTFVITRDEVGIARGGIRTAFVDAPRSANTGEFNSGGTFCRLFGIQKPFDAATLAGRYASRDEFLDAFARATKKSVKAGFVLPEEAKKQLAAIEQVPYPG